jgi:hypothetical protein
LITKIKSDSVHPFYQPVSITKTSEEPLWQFIEFASFPNL